MKFKDQEAAAAALGLELWEFVSLSRHAHWVFQEVAAEIAPPSRRGFPRAHVIEMVLDADHLERKLKGSKEIEAATRRKLLKVLKADDALLTSAFRHIFRFPYYL